MGCHVYLNLRGRKWKTREGVCLKRKKNDRKRRIQRAARQRRSSEKDVKRNIQSLRNALYCRRLADWTEIGQKFIPIAEESKHGSTPVSKKMPHVPLFSFLWLCKYRSLVLFVFQANYRDCNQQGLKQKIMDLFELVTEAQMNLALLFTIKNKRDRTCCFFI